MNSPRPHAVLFDLDGTLIDSIGLLLRCVKHAFEGRPEPHPTDDEWIAGIGTPLRQQLRAYVDSDSEIEKIVDRYRSYQRQEHDESTKAFPGVADTLERLRRHGHPMGVVTSKSDEMMNRALEVTGLGTFMNVAIGADSCQLHKPDPFPVRLALEKLDYDPEEAVFVGDSPHDIASGNAAGVHSVAALWGPFSRATLEKYSPAYYIERITDLPPLLDRLRNRSPAPA